jgi:tRNA dimethylallyltransferase
VKHKIIAIAGPTASGKTDFALNCVRHLENAFSIDSEIVNADSIQLYDELKTITAYPFPRIMKQVKHHLYGILSPHDNISVASWLELAKSKISQLRKENKIAIFCGGTGFYISTLINGISNIPPIPVDFRKEVYAKFQMIGRDVFFEELFLLDPVSHKRLHKNDTQRILRAYEVAAYTGKPLPLWRKKNRNCIDVSVIVLQPSKTELHEKCLARIHDMIRNDAIDEIADFINRYPNYNGPLADVIGYKEISDLLKGGISKQECIDLMYLRTKQYAKRQSTWFRNQLPEAKTIQDIKNFDIVNFSQFFSKII